MPHNHHEHDKRRHDDPKLLKRISGVSLLNGLIGSVELAAGFWGGNSTVTQGGLHDLADAGLFGIKRWAAGELDPARKRAIRRAGALALAGTAFVFGGYQIAGDLTEQDHEPEVAATAVGIIAAGTNLVSLGIMRGKKSHCDAKDTMRHIVEVDLPGSAVTIVLGGLALRYPAADYAGTVIHMALAARVGQQTIADTNRPVTEN